MAELLIVPACHDHIEPIASRMRLEDREEVFASSGSSPFEAMERSLAKSARAWTLIADGVPEVMCGVGELNVLSGIAAPWLLGTDAVVTHKKWFLRHSISWRDQLLARYQTLMNIVDVRNTLSVRWLKWLGAEFDPPFMVGEYEFMVFKMRASNV